MNIGKIKNHIGFFLPVALLFVMILFSCCNNMNSIFKPQIEEEKQETIEEDKTPKPSFISVKAVYLSKPRTALPSFDTDSISNFTFTLKGKAGTNLTEDQLELLKSDPTDSTDTGSYSGLTTFQNKKFPVSEAGSWTFLLTATKDGTELSSGLVTKAIELKENNELSFTLKWNDSVLDGTGSLNFTLDFSNVSNKTDISRVTGELWEYNQSTGQETQIKLNATELTFIDAAAPQNDYKITYPPASASSLPAGTYRIKIKFYAKDEHTNQQHLINTWPELVIISGGQQSSAERQISSLNQVYEIRWHNLGGNSSTTFPELYTRFSEAISLPLASTMTRTGYSFGGWYENESCTGSAQTSIAAGSTTPKDFYAKWIPNDNTPYKINHWQQNVTGSSTHNSTNYTLASTDDEVGVTDSTINPEAKDTSATGVFKGFIAPSAEELAEASTTIAPDGTTEINLYYDRQSYSVTYKDGADDTITVPAASTARYGANVTIDFSITMNRTGYSFAGWKKGDTTYTSESTDKTFTMGIEDVEITAQWTPYYVIVDGTPYADLESSISAISSATGDVNVILCGAVDAVSLGKKNSTSDSILKAFCTNTTATSMSLSVLPGVTIELAEDSSSLFFEPRAKIVSLDMHGFDTSNVKSFESMFRRCLDLTELDLSMFDTSNATNMSYMFLNCTGLTSLDISNFNTSNVEYISGMFSSCSKLESLDLSHFDTKKVKSFSSMFDSCSKLASLDISSFDTSTATSMEKMFYGCTALTELDIRNFNTDKVTTMNSMFYNCKLLTTLELSNMNTKKVTNMSSMFYGCTGLTTINVSGMFDTSGVSTSTNMFYNNTNLVGANNTEYNSSNAKDKTYACIDVDGTPGYFSTHAAMVGSNTYDTVSETVNAIKDATGDVNVYIYSGFTADNLGKSGSSGTIANAIKTSSADSINLKICEGSGIALNTDSSTLFDSCMTLKSADLRGLNTTVVTNMSKMFQGCRNLEAVDLSSFDTSLVTNFEFMFNWCESLTSLDLSSFDTFASTNMQNFLSGCEKLETITFDKTKFNTSNVTSMYAMFSNCKALTELDLSFFDTSNVTNMYGMFNGCTNLTSLDLCSFDTSKVQVMMNMFSSTDNLTSLDLSSFDTSLVTNMDQMFYNGKYNTIYVLDSFVTTSVTSSTDMFTDSTSLVGGNSTTYNSSKTDKTYARIDASGTPGYFTRASTIGDKPSPNAVGDIIFKDGSALAYTSGMTLTNKQRLGAVAVLFHTGEEGDVLGTKKLGVGIYNSRGDSPTVYKWAANKTVDFQNITFKFCQPTQPAETNYVISNKYYSGDFDGSNNWSYMTTVDSTGTSDAETNYPAFNWVNHYAENHGLKGSNATGWYMPSVTELYYLCQQQSSVDPSLAVAGGNKFESGSFWGSNQLGFYSGQTYPEQEACVSYALFVNFTVNERAPNYTDRTYTNGVCVIKEF